MGHAKQVSSRERCKIEVYLELRLSKRDIARRLRPSVHSITTYTKQGVAYGKNYRGKRPATTAFDDKRLLRAASQSNKSSSKLKHEFGLSASSRTICRRIASCPHLLRRKMLRKLPLKEEHKNVRLCFCRDDMKQSWGKCVVYRRKKVQPEWARLFNLLFLRSAKRETNCILSTTRWRWSHGLGGFL